MESNKIYGKKQRSYHKVLHAMLKKKKQALAWNGEVKFIVKLSISLRFLGLQNYLDVYTSHWGNREEKSV